MAWPKKEYKNFECLSSLSLCWKYGKMSSQGPLQRTWFPRRHRGKALRYRTGMRRNRSVEGLDFVTSSQRSPWFLVRRGSRACKLSPPLLITEPLNLLLAHMATQSENYILQGPLLPVVAIWLNSGQLKLLERVLKMQRHALMLPLSEVNLWCDGWTSSSHIRPWGNFGIEAHTW